MCRIANPWPTTVAKVQILLLPPNEGAAEWSATGVEYQGGYGQGFDSSTFVPVNTNSPKLVTVAMHLGAHFKSEIVPRAPLRAPRSEFLLLIMGSQYQDISLLYYDHICSVHVCTLGHCCAY